MEERWWRRTGCGCGARGVSNLQYESKSSCCGSWSNGESTIRRSEDCPIENLRHGRKLRPQSTLGCLQDRPARAAPESAPVISCPSWIARVPFEPAIRRQSKFNISSVSSCAEWISVTKKQRNRKVCRDYSPRKTNSRGAQFLYSFQAALERTCSVAGSILASCLWIAAKIWKGRRILLLGYLAQI